MNHKYGYFDVVLIVFLPQKKDLGRRKWVVLSLMVVLIKRKEGEHEREEMGNWKARAPAV